MQILYYSKFPLNISKQGLFYIYIGHAKVNYYKTKQIHKGKWWFCHVACLLSFFIILKGEEVEEREEYW